MSASVMVQQAAREDRSDEEIVESILQGETGLYEIIMRRYNQRLYRIARSIVQQDTEAEDVMQDTYVRAYQNLKQFAGRSRFSAWLTRIAVNEALGRRKYSQRHLEIEGMPAEKQEALLTSGSASPEHQAATRELGTLLEDAILSLPDAYRPVLMMRDVEEMSTVETATALDLSEENVKVRLHRARAMLRRELYARAGSGYASAFPFLGNRCNAIVNRVLELIGTNGIRINAN
jgi:RNA polymerase sigma-70 factor (ECF subfamily)